MAKQKKPRKRRTGVVKATIEEVQLEGDYCEVDGVTATCTECGHTTESFGTEGPSVRRCLALLREGCPRGLDNYYTSGLENDELYSWESDEHTVRHEEPKPHLVRHSQPLPRIVRHEEPRPHFVRLSDKDRADLWNGPAPEEILARARAMPRAKPRPNGAGVMFRCPQCAAQGGDEHYENAIVTKDGHWLCTVAPNERAHRRAIGVALGVIIEIPEADLSKHFSADDLARVGSIDLSVDHSKGKIGCAAPVDLSIDHTKGKF